jgi:hypothetical protein
MRLLPMTLSLKEVQLCNRNIVYLPAGNVWPSTKAYLQDLPNRAITLGFTEYLTSELKNA